MFWNIDTIGKRLFLSFSILALNVILISALSWHFIVSNKQIYQVSKCIETQRIQIVRLLRLDLDFLRFETLNQEFYKTNNSELIHRRDSIYTRILHETNMLHNDMLIASLGIHDPFKEIDSTLKAYNNTFSKIKEKITQRGFKDYGLEGTMRKYAHELEKQTPEISMVNVLTLRRHEKDYFLRKEKQYKTKLNNIVNQLIHTITEDKDKNSFLVYLLKSYQDTFNELASIDEEIGLVPTQGLLGRLNSLTNDLSQQLESLVSLSDERADATIKRSLITYLVVGVCSIIISLALTYITARRLTRPIKKLSGTIGKFIVTQGLNEDDLLDTAVTNEINNLSGAFIKMTKKLKTQFEEIQRKSELLEKRNKELQKLNDELDRFIYSAAHDLKSPLASMEGLVYLVRREINIPQHNHYFDKMRLSIEKMEGFIRDITDYAKNKRQQIRADKINIDDIFDQIFESLQFIPHTENIEKIVHIEQGEFFTDRTRLEIILKNIISNALRYADLTKSKSFVNISTRIATEKVIVRIEDNGIGIEEQHLPFIFDMFYRANENSKGSGIGLFLVRESVKMLRGTISVESEPGKGTTFILHLPNLKQMNVNNLPESEPIQLLTAVV